MIALAGAAVVLPDRVLDRGTVVIDGDRIVEVTSALRPASRETEASRSLHGHFLVPGFIDVHVHGVLGVDSLDGDEAIAAMARALPRFGVTAFAPTSIACEPARLGRLLQAVGRARANRDPAGARVLPAHLESNFISPAWAGAQPVACLRRPPSGTAGREATTPGHEDTKARRREATGDAFTAEDILAEIERARPDVGIVTLAPELEGALDLIGWLVERGYRVSMGHSGATCEQAADAIRAGARHATHLFNRMRPMTHRDPGLTGAVLATDEVAAEIICDGHHVHPTAVRVAVAAKSPSRVMAITDGTAGAGLSRGARAALGGQPITVGDTARLDDGTMAGSVLTMDRAFAFLTGPVGLGPVEAAHLCATTPARALDLRGHGAIAPGAVADLVVLDPHLHVVETWVGGMRVFERGGEQSTLGTGEPCHPRSRL
jgi:N-acetylglucosamine-6-phosphate deacetylase